MAVFDVGETVICSIEVRNSSGSLKSPTTMQIKITDPDNTTVVTTQVMQNDSTGLYHHDYTSSSSAITGEYNVTYTATDSSRITIQKDEFRLE